MHCSESEQRLGTTAVLTCSVWKQCCTNGLLNLGVMAQRLEHLSYEELIVNRKVITKLSETGKRGWVWTKQFLKHIKT